MIRRRRSVRRPVLVLCAAALAAVPLVRSASPPPRPALPQRAAPFALDRVLAAAAAPHRVADGCAAGSGVVCSVVDVPLDRTGAVPGSVPLHVEMLPSDGARKGVVFLLAGGPGQGSAETFSLGDKTMAGFLRFLFPGYTLVAYDDRGTGASGPLDCSSIDGAGPGDDETLVAATCAAELGPGAGLYRTSDHAADLDAVRQALGFARVAVMGISYGTRQALAYAAAFPQRVERLVLDSVEGPSHDSAFAADVLRAMPGTLAHYCAGTACAHATSDLGGDVAAVANRLAAGLPAGAPLSAVDFLDLVVSADLSPGLAAELPAAVHAARAGDFRPLLHVLRIGESTRGAEAADVSGTLYLATVCDDGPFPWQQAAALPDREAALSGALAALPAGALGPFGVWAAELGSARVCAGWPASGGGLPAGQLPNVPVLALSGGLDLRTPTAGAADVVASFPQGRLLVVPGTGHSVLTSDGTLCSQLALRAWVESGSLPETTCPRGRAFVPPLAAFPRSPKARLGAAASRALALSTLHEAEAAWFASAGAGGGSARVRGIYGGSLDGTVRAFTLKGYSIARGVTLSGRVSVSGSLPPLRFAGSIRLGGPLAAHGTLKLSRGALTGKLG